MRVKYLIGESGVCDSLVPTPNASQLRVDYITATLA